MVKYICKRLGLAVIILLGVSLIIYFLIRLMPYDYVEQTISQIDTGALSPDAVKAMYEAYGLSDNSFWGIIKGYFEWLWRLVRFDTVSYTHLTLPTIRLV